MPTVYTHNGKAYTRNGVPVLGDCCCPSSGCVSCDISIRMCHVQYDSPCTAGFGYGMVQFGVWPLAGSSGEFPKCSMAVDWSKGVEDANHNTQFCTSKTVSQRSGCHPNCSTNVTTVGAWSRPADTWGTGSSHWCYDFVGFEVRSPAEASALFTRTQYCRGSGTNQGHWDERYSISIRTGANTRASVHCGQVVFNSGGCEQGWSSSIAWSYAWTNTWNPPSGSITEQASLVVQPNSTGDVDYVFCIPSGRAIGILVERV